MLQQTQVATVIPYWTRWMEALPDVRALAHAPLDRVLKLWEGLGYYRRARHAHEAAQVIVNERGGQMPVRFEDWLALPGVGRYTAGAICSIAFNQPTPVLDGNVMRVLARLMGWREDPHAPGADNRWWACAQDLVTAASRLTSPAGQQCGALNQALMELGATLCTPRQPQCPQCPLRQDCAAFRLGLTEEIPAPRARPETMRQTWCAFVIEHKERVLVRRREGQSVNNGLYEFPCLESKHGETADMLAQQLLGAKRLRLKEQSAILHSITHHRITLRVFVAEALSARIQCPGAEWVHHQDLSALAFTAAHRKIARRLYPDQ